MKTVNNSVKLIGYLGKTPKVITLKSGIQVANFSIATDQSYKNKEGKKITKTQWHNIVVWNGLAKIVEQYLKKGSLVAMQGQLTSRSYEDKNNIKREITEIVCDEMQMLDRKYINTDILNTNNQNIKDELQPANATIIDNEINKLPF